MTIVEVPPPPPAFAFFTGLAAVFLGEAGAFALGAEAFLGAGDFFFLAAAAAVYVCKVSKEERVRVSLTERY